MKQQFTICKKVVNHFKCGTCDKPKITLEGFHYHIKHYHNNKQHFELNMPVKVSLNIVKDLTETMHPYYYAKALNKTMQLKTCFPLIHA